MKPIKIILTIPEIVFYLLIAVIVGILIHKFISNLERLNTTVAEHDSQLAQIKAREMQIEAQKANRHWVRYILMPVTWIVGKLIAHW